jgi:DNA invertase Pin-like site-specific DNA recombinase
MLSNEKVSKIGVLYGRVSTNFVRQGHSIELQDDRLRRYCQWKDIQIADVLHEDTSGTVPFLERPMGAAVWRDWLGCGRAHHLVLTCVDRLGRNAADMLAFFERCDQAGIRVHLVDLGAAIDFSDPNGRLFIQLMALFAENERLRIVDRITRTLASLRSHGYAVGKEPYGWRHIGTGEFRDRGGSRVEKKRVEEDPVEQGFLRWMVDLRLAGHTYAAIAVQLNQARVAPKLKAGTVLNVGSGRTSVAPGRWTASGVESVLTNRYTRTKYPDLNPAVA